VRGRKVFIVPQPKRSPRHSHPTFPLSIGRQEAPPSRGSSLEAFKGASVPLRPKKRVFPDATSRPRLPPSRSFSATIFFCPDLLLTPGYRIFRPFWRPLGLVPTLISQVLPGPLSRGSVCSIPPPSPFAILLPDADSPPQHAPKDLLLGVRIRSDPLHFYPAPKCYFFHSDSANRSLFPSTYMRFALTDGESFCFFSSQIPRSSSLPSRLVSIPFSRVISLRSNPSYEP